MVVAASLSLCDTRHVDRRLWTRLFFLQGARAPLSRWTSQGKVVLRPRARRDEGRPGGGPHPVTLPSSSVTVSMVTV